MGKPNYILYDNVVVHGVIEVGPFAVVGYPYRGMPPGEITEIGEGALIRSHTVIYAGNRIGRNFQTGHGAFIRECNMIGDNVSIGTRTVVEHHVIIEDGVRIHSQAFIPEYTHLKRGCWVGPCVVITNARYPLSPRAKEELRGAVVEPEAKIGANATLLPGVRVGRNALVAAGAVVVKDVPDGAVVAGNPAVIINWVKNLPYGENE